MAIRVKTQWHTCVGSAESLLKRASAKMDHWDSLPPQIFDTLKERLADVTDVAREFDNDVLLLDVKNLKEKYGKAPGTPKKGKPTHLTKRPEEKTRGEGGAKTKGRVAVREGLEDLHRHIRAVGTGPRQ